MKKFAVGLGFALLLGIADFAFSAPIVTVIVSTGVRQPNTTDGFWLSRSTSTTFFTTVIKSTNSNTAITINPDGSIAVGTMTFSNLSGSTITFNYANITLINASTMTVSSLTVTGMTLNTDLIRGTTNGNTLTMPNQAISPGSFGVTSATQSWTAPQSFRSSTNFNGPITTGTFDASGTSGMALQSRGAGSPPNWTWTGLILQSTFTNFPGNNSNSASYQGVVGSTITFTPKASTNKAKIVGSFNFTTVATGQRCTFTVMRGATDLGGAGGVGVGASQITVAGLSVNLHMASFGPIYDSYNTSSPVSYSLMFKSDGTNQCYMGNFVGNQVNSFGIEEIGQ